MRLREFFYLLGLKPKPRSYGYDLRAFELAREGRVEVAQWRLPGAYQMTTTQEAIDQLRQFLQPGDLAVDVGAHAGDSTLPIALAVGPTGLVLALEPNSYVFPILARNASLNPTKTHIIPLPFAAMRVSGQYEFHYGGPGYGNGGYHEGMSRWLHGSAFTLPVEGRNLADYLAQQCRDWLPRLRYIKIDAEGFDLAILETLAELLEAYRPFLHVEFFTLRKSLPGYRQRLYRFLVAHDYEVHHVAGSAQLCGPLVTPANLMSWRQCDVFCVPRPRQAPPN
jgi:FkbM family methyltransferase